MASFASLRFRIDAKHESFRLTPNLRFAEGSTESVTFVHLRAKTRTLFLLRSGVFWHKSNLSPNLLNYLLTYLLHGGGTAVALWLRCCATNRKVAGSIPAGVNGFFVDIKSFRSHYGPGVDSASNRNEYQEFFLGVKAAGA